MLAYIVVTATPLLFGYLVFFFARLLASSSGNEEEEEDELGKLAIHSQRATHNKLTEEIN